MEQTINISVSKKIFNPKYLPYLDDNSKYLVFYGGGSSGKSYFLGSRYILWRLLREKRNLLVIRQTSKSNRDSTFALFKQLISRFNLRSICKVTDLRIKILNGSEIIFAGLDDVEKIKSTTFESGELTDIWIEEATECSEEDINQLKVRLRGGTTKKQMVLSFNPIDASHWIKKHFVDGEVEKATVCFSTHKDNIFLTDEDRQTLENFKKTDPYFYNVYCLGQWGVLGKTYFNAENIHNRLQTIKEPIKTGYFKYNYNLNRQMITDFEWVEDKEGFIRIYEDVDKYTPYVIGGDTAGEGSDYFTGHVIDNISGKQVATLRKEFDEIEYTRQMYCLGKYFNNALIGIEANFSSYPIKELERLGYSNQFVRTVEDSYTGKLVKSLGFKTTSVTRPIILADLQRIVLEEIYRINDKATLEEMLTFVRNEKGRPEAQQNAHDDLVMGLAISFYTELREQQSMKKLGVKTGIAVDFNSVGSDYGDNLEII